VSPQHESDNDTERESRSQRGDWTIRYDVLDMDFLFGQCLAEIVQRGFDLVGDASTASPDPTFLRQVNLNALPRSRSDVFQLMRNSDLGHRPSANSHGIRRCA
jgi:hypothetical protein